MSLALPAGRGMMREAVAEGKLYRVRSQGCVVKIVLSLVLLDAFSPDLAITGGHRRLRRRAGA